MPLLSRTFIKAGLVYFVVALLVGVLYWGQPIFNFPANLGVLYPVYIHLLMLGWITQLIIGVVYWMFPKYSKENPRGSDRLGWFVFGLLNDGLILRSAVAGRAVLDAKVALADVFWVKSLDDQSRSRVYTNKIDRKHVDFLLCDAAAMQPILGIELDDKSHQRPDRQDRDAFVDQVFAAAKLPLLHVPAKRAYVVAELAAQLALYLGASTTPAPPVAPAAANPASTTPMPSQASVVTPAVAIKRITPVITTAMPASSPTITNEAPHCPKCGSAMILRTTKNGANSGNQFWGCSTYPSCRGMVAVTD